MEDELDKLYDQLVQALEECDTLLIDQMVAPLADAEYLESGSFGSKPFLLRPEIAKKMKKEGIAIKERYTLSEYSTLLTSYIISNKCVDEYGIVTPTPFLCKLLKISSEPCSIIQFLGMATKILL